MTDSIDKKLQEKHDNLDDLDAMLDEAESSLVQMNEFQDDEDAIDRLLIDTGFDSDEALTHPTAQKDIGLHDELDDLLGFDDFDDFVNEPEETQALVDVDDSDFASSNELQDDEDALDRLLTAASLKTDDMPMQTTGHDDESGLEALDDFSDFSAFNEPEIDLQDSPQTTAAKEGNEPELAIEDLAALADNVDLSDEIDTVGESDMPYEDNIAAPALAEIDESDAQDDVGADNELDEFSDFSDFSEPDILPEIENDEPEPVIESLSEQVDDVGLPDEIDEFFSLSDNFDESDMIPDDEIEVSAPAEAESIASDPEPQAVVEQPLLEEADDFSGFVDDFNESDRLQDDELEVVPAPAEAELSASDLEPQAVVEQPLVEEADDFSGFVDDVNESDRLQEDELEVVPAPAEAESIASDSEPQAVVEQPLVEEVDDFSGFVDDFNESDKLQNDELEVVPAPAEAEAIASDPEPQAVVEQPLLEEADDFSGFVDDFNESDRLQDDELEVVPAPAEAESIASDPEPQAVVEQPLVEEVDDFSGFVDDVNESDRLQEDELEMSAPAETELSGSDPELQAVVEQPVVEEVDDFSGFIDDFNESDRLQDDELEVVPAPAEAESIASDPEPQAVVEQPLVEEVDDFSGFVDDFNESDRLQDDELEVVPAPAEAESIASDPEPQAVVEQLLVEEVDDFSGFADDFNESDRLQDDELEVVPAPAEAESIASDPEPQAVVEQPLVEEVDDFSGFVDDFNESDRLQDDELEVVPAPAEAESIASDPEPQAVVEQLLVEEVDDFSGFADDFNESDMLQDDELEVVPAPAEAESIASDQESETAVEESFNDLLNDENGIDSLLMDSDFDTEDVEEQTVGKKDAFGDDVGLSEIDDFFQLDEVSDDFSMETGEDQLVGTEQSIQDEDDFLLPDFDITADMEMSDMVGNSGIKEDDLADAFADTDFMNEEGAVQSFDSEAAGLNAGADEAMPESQSKPAAKTAIEDPVDQDDIKKQLKDAENKVKKARIFSYVALGFGVVAVSAAVALGVMTHGAKSEISKLTEQVSTLEASLAKSAQNNPNEEINAVMNSVAQLNHQVYGFITELKGNSQIPVDVLNSNVSGIVAKQGMVSKALDTLQVKMGWEGKVLLESLVAEPPKVDAVHEPAPAPIPAPAKEGNMHGIAPVKTEHASTKEDVAHEHVATKEDKIAPTKERAKHEAAPAKVEAVLETAPAKVKAQPEAAPAKPITPPQPVVLKEEPVKPGKQTTVAKWGVNLVAFKQEWFAKSKAAEFARLGVFAEVIPVYEKNTMMYRLRVGGFKSKAEALSNTNRIKKTLNLGSVWVSDN